MPSGQSSAPDWVERLRRLIALAACGIVLTVSFASSVANVCVVAGFLAWCGLLLAPSGAGERRWPPLGWCWAWLIAAALFSFVNTAFPVESLRGMLKLGKALMIYTVGVELGRSARGPRWLLRTAWIAVTVSAINGLWQWRTGIDALRGLPTHLTLDHVQRITSGFHDPNNFGMFLGLTLPLGYLLARTATRLRDRLVGWSGVALGAAALFFTYSRGAALGLLTAATVIIVSRRDHGLLIGLLAVLGLASWCLPPSVRHWVAHTGSPLVALTNADRLQMWQSSWRMISAHPWLGVGIGTFSRRYAEFKVAGDPLMASYAHNTYLQLWAVTGANGLLAFLVLCWRGGRLWRTARPVDPTAAVVGLGCIAGVAAFLTHGLLESNLSSSKLSMLFWLLAGIAMGIATPRTPPTMPPTVNAGRDEASPSVALTNAALTA